MGPYNQKWYKKPTLVFLRPVQSYPKLGDATKKIINILYFFTTIGLQNLDYARKH